MKNKILKEEIEILKEKLKNQIEQNRILKEKLSFQEILNNSLINGMHDMVWIIDFEGNLIDVNNKVIEVLGYSKKELLSKGITGIDSSLNKKDIKALARAMPFDKLQIFETSHKTKDGKTFPVEINSSLITYLGKPAILSISRDISERKHAEEELRASEEKYRSIFENIQNVYYETMLDGTIIEISPSIELVSRGQYSRDDLIGKSMYEFYTNPNDRDTLISEIQKTGSLTNFEAELRNRDGSTIWCSISAKIIITPEGKVEKIIGSMHDISERKKAEETVAKERALLRTLIDNLPNGVFIKDNNYRKVIANSLHISSMAGHLASIGLDPTIDIIGKTDFEVTLKEWADIYFTDDQKVIRDGIPLLNKEEEGYGPDGKKIWLLISKIPIRDDNGEINGMVGITTDITVLKMAEEAVTKERTLLRTLIENLPVGIFVKDIDYRKIIVNPIHINEVEGHLKYLGIKSKIDLIGKTDFEVFPKKMAKEFFEEDQEIIRDGLIINNREGIGYTEKGKQKYLLISKIPLRDSDNNIIGLVGVTNDITERKQAEKELIKAKEKAEESDKLKSAFLANMSHEIRTPMNAILGFSRLLVNPNLSDEKKNIFIQLINNSGNHLLALINDIIDISKIEANLLTIKKRPCDIHHLISETIAILTNSPILKSKKEVSLVLNLPKNVNECIIESDPERLKQVFNNLIVNAIKNTSKGYVEVGYTIIKKNKAQSIQFYVKDTGIGIPDDKKHLIFQRFRQVNEFTYHEGTGLGLSISKGIIEMLGGNIGFDSKYQEGSTFYFSLPYTSKYENINLQKGQQISKKIKTNWKNKTIVVAEDDIPSMQYIKELLLPTGIKIVHVYNGKALLEYLDKNMVDIILLDINMPVMNGFEAMRKLHEKNINIPVIAQTAYALSNEKEKAIKMGCNDYLTKPFDQNQLFNIITKYL